MSARDTTVIVSIYQHFKTDTMNAFTDAVGESGGGGRGGEVYSQVSYKLVTCCQLYIDLPRRSKDSKFSGEIGGSSLRI